LCLSSQSSLPTTYLSINSSDFLLIVFNLIQFIFSATNHTQTVVCN
jgi:hypothetical protein